MWRLRLPPKDISVGLIGPMERHIVQPPSKESRLGLMPQHGRERATLEDPEGPVEEAVDGQPGIECAQLTGMMCHLAVLQGFRDAALTLQDVK
jgi:hypothetical protein